jgi:hypothetical protein
MLNKKFKASVTAAVLTLGLSTSSALADTNNNNATAAFQATAVKTDYVTDCKSNSCAPGEAAGWSSKPENENAVAVAIRMGTEKQLPDFEIKSILLGVFEKAGISANNVRFFFEDNDIKGTGLSYHVRGGTDGPFVLNREAIAAAQTAARIAKYDHLASVNHNNPSND